MSLTRPLRKVASVESLTEHGLDNGLAADVQRLGLTIQLLSIGAVKSTFTRWTGLTTVN